MKQKTKKAAAKRFRFSARRKVTRRAVHQAHFNGKDSGKDSRRKHGPESVDQTDLGRIRDLLPYSS